MIGAEDGAASDGGGDDARSLSYSITDYRAAVSRVVRGEEDSSGVSIHVSCHCSLRSADSLLRWVRQGTASIGTVTAACETG